MTIAFKAVDDADTSNKPLEWTGRH
jgi:hypothetical protein